MTGYREEPIGPAEHHKDCPMHEDFGHECRSEYELKHAVKASVVWDNHHWILDVHRTNVFLRVDFCPWCGEELDPPECQCHEIREAMKEYAAELREDR